jgi:hypothetical protein
MMISFFRFSVQWSTGGMKLTGENRSTRGGKPVPVTFCPPQIQHGIGPVSNPGLLGERYTTNRLSHRTANSTSYFRDTLYHDISKYASHVSFQLKLGLYYRLGDRYTLMPFTITSCGSTRNY